ncbi:hypothetical protein [Anatilimnocola floriformis]|uniref:hypothetical protein n=1 Tax=Anatilimnocola floriformis TaxID=2948575 RepID=UPI0020C5A004|nr:hypothetical protein [Anatilimnocola floriformis]
MSSSRTTTELRATWLPGVIIRWLGIIMLSTIVPKMLTEWLLLRQVSANESALNWVLLFAALLLVGYGWISMKKGVVRLILSRKDLDFPQQELAIPWQTITRIELTNGKLPSGKGVPMLLVWLTPTASRELGNQVYWEVPAPGIAPPPMISQRINYRLIDGIEGPFEFIDYLRERVAAAGGSAGVPRKTKIPSAADPLELRDEVQAGSPSRSFTCEICGGQTLAKDSVLKRLCNPLRVASVAQCTGCGEFPVLSKLRWTDTGETLEAFRKRMWRKTPAACAIAHYLLLLPLAGLLTIACIPPNVVNPGPPIGLYVVCFGIAWMVMLVTFSYTPFANLVPALFGVTYHRYR